MPSIVGLKESVALEKLADKGLEGNSDNVTYIYSSKYAKGIVVSQSVKVGTKVNIGTVIDYTVSMGPEEIPTEAPATPNPTTNVSYRYEGTITVSGNPFDYEDEEPAVIKLVLTQAGKTKTVWSDTLTYDDFPRKFTITGWSDNNGTVTIYKDDVSTGFSYDVDFKKVVQ